MKEQRYTSAGTSINSKKIPTAFKKIKPIGNVCDYGCGKYTEHIKNYCMEKGAKTYNPIDPYNQIEEINKNTRIFGSKNGFDTIYICNVLNVIDNDATVQTIIKDAFDYINSNGNIIIQIYEGDKTGTGKQTKKDCYQRNEKTSDYLRFLHFLTGIAEIKIKNNIITIKNKIPFDPPYKNI